MRLKNCVECYSSTLTESEISGQNGTYPVYGATGVISFTDSPQVKECAILIVKDGSGVGNIQFSKTGFSVIGTLNYLTKKEGVSLKYIFYCLKMFSFKRYKVGSGIPHIYFKDYGGAKIYCPDIKVQGKIASTLSAIDKKIEFESKHLKLLKKQKQYFLQNLFI